ncbi:MAG TPA: Ig-like domain repeat protein [Terracidiphilus sp.]
MKLFGKSGAFALGVFGALVLCSAGYGQTFTVTVAPSSLTIYPGQQNVPVAITVGASSYAEPISVTLTGLPSGITVSPLTLTAGGSGTLKLSASVSAGQKGFSPSAPSITTSWTAAVSVVAAAGSTRATAPLALTVSISNPSFAPAPSAIDLPILTIDTSGAPIANKTTDVPGTVTITSADGQTSYLPNSSDTDNTATFHVHGNTTADMPKLAYEMKLNTSLDLLNTMGLNCPYVTGSKNKPTCDKSKTYILLANYDDKTFLRDWAASALANAIPLTSPYLASPAGSPSPSGTSTLMPWAPHSLFVELYLNGVYEGNYQLIEKVNVDSHRINITELTDTDTADVTGSYLLEIDQHRDEDYVFSTPHGIPIGLIDPDFTPEVAQQTSYITSYVDDAETALFSSDFTDPTLGWRAYFDESSAVNFYIVNDLMGNADGGSFFSSDYLYKDLDNPLLYMGPIWDFDVSAGNVNYVPIENATVPWMQQEALWYIRWFEDPGFKADVVTQWNTLKNNGVFSTWLASIPQEAKTLEQSQANNLGRWPMQGIKVWPNPEAAGSYNGEVQYLTNWLQLRLAYLDSKLNNKAQTATSLSLGNETLRSGSPVTLTAEVTGGTGPSGVVSFLSTGVVLGTGSLSAGTASLTASNLPAGTDEIQAVYNGDQTNGMSSSNGQLVTVLPPLTATTLSIAGPSSVTEGLSSTFTATVIPSSNSGVPTGTVTFSVDGGKATPATVNGTGTGTYSTSSLAAGTHTLTAVYSGDTNFAAATSSVLTVRVGSDFTIMSSNPLVMAHAGDTATFNIALSPADGEPAFASAVALSVTGLPTGTTYSFSPASVPAGSGPTAVTLTVQAPQTTAASLPANDGLGRGLAPLSLALILLPFAGKVRKTGRRLGRTIAVLLVLGGLAAIGGLSGCGSGSAQKTYFLVVTGTQTGATGTLSHSTDVSLTVE